MAAAQATKAPGDEWGLTWYIRWGMKQKSDFYELWQQRKQLKHLEMSEAWLGTYDEGWNEKSDFYELWQQYKQLKHLEMNEAWLDTYDEGCIHQFQPELTHKIH